MKVISARVSDETMASLNERATREDKPVGDLVRRAVEAYLAVEAVNGGGAATLSPSQSAKEEKLPPRDCDHPRSRWLQLPNGVLCDRCGTWL